MSEIERTECPGPVYFGDQGIEFCEECGECLCCGPEDVSHDNAVYRCWLDRDGNCALKTSKYHPNHVRDEDI